MHSKARRALMLFCIAIPMFSTTATAGRPNDDQVAADVRAAMARVQEADSTLEATLGTLVGYAIFPEVARGSLGAGGVSERGEVYEGGKLVGHARIYQQTTDTPVGAQKFVELILFKRKSALTRFMKNRLELSAQATAIAADQGAAAKAKYADGVAIIVLPTAGRMTEASIAGQKLHFIPLNPAP